MNHRIGSEQGGYRVDVMSRQRFDVLLGKMLDVSGAGHQRIVIDNSTQPVGQYAALRLVVWSGRVGSDKVGRFVLGRVDEELQLDVVRISKHDGGSVVVLDDSRMRYLVDIEMGDPALELGAVTDAKRQVIESDATLAEFLGWAIVVRHHGHDETCGVHERPSVEARAAKAIDEREAHHVLPPIGRPLTLSHR
jgi:hypothetical protein